VTDRVDLDRVRSLLDGISARKLLSDLRQEARNADVTEHGMWPTTHNGNMPMQHADRPTKSLFLDVPEIVVVEEITSTPPPATSRDITSARRQSASTSSWTEPETPTHRDRFELLDLAPIGAGGAGSSSQSSSRGLRRDRRLSDMSALSADLGLRYTYVVLVPWIIQSLCSSMALRF